MLNQIALQVVLLFQLYAQGLPGRRPAPVAHKLYLGPGDLASQNIEREEVQYPSQIQSTIFQIFNTLSNLFEMT